MTAAGRSIPAQGNRADVAEARAARGADGERRRAVLDALRAHGPLDAGAVARTVGLAPSTVRFHLDRLVDDGLVEVERDPAHRRGRPRMNYTAVPEVAADTGAAMHRLAVIMAASLDGAGPGAAEQAGRGWAADVLQRRVAAGLDLRPGVRDAVDHLVAVAVDVLEEEGFAPRLDASGTAVDLHRCPYLTVAVQHPRAVCGLHLGLLQGLAEGLGVEATWRLRPDLTGLPCTAVVEPPSS